MAVAAAARPVSRVENRMVNKNKQIHTLNRRSKGRLSSQTHSTAYFLADGFGDAPRRPTYIGDLAALEPQIVQSFPA
jgi:hypothetical protein